MALNSYGELEAELAAPQITPIDPDDRDYVDLQLRFLGPSADISHPDFGRDNLPTETYRMVDEIVYPFGDNFAIKVIHHIFDAAGNKISSTAEDPNPLYGEYFRMMTEKSSEAEED